MDEDGWFRFTSDLDSAFPSVTEDFFEQVNQINFCLSKKELLKEEKDDEEKEKEIQACQSLFHTTFNSGPSGPLSTFIKKEVFDEDDEPEEKCPPQTYDFSDYTKPSIDVKPKMEVDLYKFEDFSSGSDCGSCSPSDFGPCASSNGSSKLFSVPRPGSLSLRTVSQSSSSIKLEDTDNSQNDVTFIVDSEPDIPSPTPPANDASPYSCAAMLERMGNINETPVSAPISMRGVRSPRTSLQTMTGSGGYLPLTEVDNATGAVSSSESGRRPHFGVSKSLSRSFPHPVRHFLHQSATSRHRSLHSRKTPHYTSRPHPSLSHHHSHPGADELRRSSVHHRPPPSPIHGNSMRPVDMRSPKYEEEENPPRLWKFLFDLLEGKKLPHKLVEWTDRSTLTFRLVDSKEVSRLWGIKKHKPNMCYESLGRSLRYYYGKGVLEKVETQRLCYRYKRDHLVKNGIYIS